MSYPYPQDRSRDKREKGSQPYQDAKEAMTQEDARLQAEAEAFGEAHPQETDEERRDRMADEARERLRQVGQEPSDQ